ncbi:MAG: hypothetical protein P1V97_03715 [Planctomycetota bacterium]|nr:hypothetical protein [Planctomycetota bacterium]
MTDIRSVAGQSVWATVLKEATNLFVVLVSPKIIAGSMVAYLPKRVASGIPLSPGTCLECVLDKRMDNGVWLVFPRPDAPVSILYLQRSRRDWLELERDHAI